jgi:hypothetical protein
MLCSSLLSNSAWKLLSLLYQNQQAARIIKVRGKENPKYIQNEGDTAPSINEKKLMLNEYFDVSDSFIYASGGNSQL